MSGLPESAKEVLEGASLAHLVTLNEDGSPQVTCVWAGLDGEEIVCGHLFPQRKIANIERDPRVAISFEAEGLTERGLARYLVVYGTRARITPESRLHLYRPRRQVPADGGPAARLHVADHGRARRGRRPLGSLVVVGVERFVDERVRLGVLLARHATDRPARKLAQGGHRGGVQRLQIGLLDLVLAGDLPHDQL